MLQTFLKITFRSFLRQKLYTFLNIFGLALGLAATIIIITFSTHELTYDQYHEKSESIFMAYKERITPNETQATYDTWVPMGERLVTEYPEAINSTRFFTDNSLFEIGDERFEGSLAYSDESLFQMFDFDLIKGDVNNPFPIKNAIILSQEMATKYFGDADPIGKTLRIDFERVYEVTGVLRPIPTNSSIQIDHLISLKTIPEYPDYENNWGGSFLHTYVQLDNPNNAASLEAKFPDLIKNIWDAEVQNRTNFKLLPLHNVYSTIIGDTDIAYILLYIAAGILLISSINFINLFASSALGRSKEVAVKKVIGSSRKQLARQFLGESLVVSSISMGIAILLVSLCLPFINSAFDLQLAVGFNQFSTIAVLVSLTLIISMLSGAYPAYLISRFGIISSLKGSFDKSMGKNNLRDLMIAFQFVVSILLIVGTLVINDQISFMQNTDMGFKKDNQVAIPLSLRDFESSDSTTITRIETFKNEIAKHSDVISITTSRNIPTDWTNSYLFVRPDGWDGDPLRMAYTYHDAKFFETYGIEIIQGSNFNDDAYGDQRESAVLNKSAMEAFGFEDIEGKAIRIGNNRINVVGVIDNFNFETMRDEVRPIIHFHRVPSNAAHSYLTINARPGKAKTIIDFAESKWSILNSTLPFDYAFIDENVATMYESESRLLLMSTIFSTVAIIIACLGLFGIVSYNVEKRKKEIGIRKVLGASIYSIVQLMSKRFAALILIGFVVSVPIGIYYLNDWLNGFAYHIEISPMVFGITILAVLAVAMITVSAKTIQAGLANPVNVLKED
ncbi:ABC transporter permease [Fulvivirga lutimaris]|uniref:ABC transporter permease n=1 Tax=Fulvivirga lutimaris TaxID=1819566 RepID=UPI0012BC2677|nr:ABC transporter permease [Fulvivirga lutimaris]MTI41760.1 ABC transporter permease [Fulvivirga lutimaris]